MTLAELNQHLERVRELQGLQQLYSRMLDKAAPGAQRLDGMPRKSYPGDPTAVIGIHLAELQTAIERKKESVQMSAGRVEAFIERISSERIRMLFRLRFLQGLAWCEVTELWGQYISEDAVKKACYRELKRMETDREKGAHTQ